MTWTYSEQAIFWISSFCFIILPSLGQEPQTRDGCVYNLTTTYAVGEKFNIGCDQICICNVTGKADCRDRCRYKPGSVVDSSCIEVPDENDPDCCVTYKCKENSVDIKAPKVLVTQKSQKSLAIAWDDFKLPNYQSGYVVEYRLVGGNQSDTKWHQIQANNTPFLTINKLTPHSKYQIKIGVWEDSEKKKVADAGSEVINAETEDGCSRNNSTYSVGQEFFEGCDLRCVCKGSNEGECSDRCTQPYFRAGIMKDDPGCTEEPIPGGDSCCVILKCPGHDMEKKTDEISFSDKPGYCPEAVERRITDEKGVCIDECAHDYHCLSSLKCCSTSCGGSICAKPIMGRSLCDDIACGPNAECVHPADGELSSAKCRCRYGFTGDPNDLKVGCKKTLSVKTKLVCQYKNKTYVPMEEFFEGCKSKCICSEALEIECVPRCPFDSSAEIYDPLCTVIEDPKDSCCKILACESKQTFQLEPLENTTIGETFDVDKPLPFTGCHHKNETYNPGESFTDGCESKCICQKGGKLECMPRCPLFQGYEKRFCELLPDPDDPECCKIAVCDRKEGDRKENPPLILDSAEPYNSTSAQLRVIVPNGFNETNGLGLKLLFAEVDASFAFETEKLDLKWTESEVVESDVKIIGTNVYEVQMSNLKPATEYFMKVLETKTNATSNTVVVRTYPPGIDSSFNGCFHGNKTYEIDDVFYDGCEYKCVCREGGLRECEERCPVFIDTVGYENCEWGPSPDDSCCTIPTCNNEDKEKILPKTPLNPESESFCVSENGMIHTVDQTWDEGVGCLKKACQCVQLKNGTTITECKGGCAVLPKTALKPSIECPKPEMITPDDPCLCPYIVCSHNLNPINLPPRLPGSQKPAEIMPETHGNPTNRDKSFCEFKGRKINLGEEFHDDCRSVCHCGFDGRVNCALIECPHQFAPHVSECIEWDINPNFVPKPPECCPPTKCKNDGSCHFAGIRLANFKAVPQELLPCGTRCVCVNGNVTCDNRCPSLSETPPPNLPCPASMQYRGYLPGDTCCLHWMCREPERAAFCLHNGHRYKLGEQWDDNPIPGAPNGLSSRKRCQCKPNTTGNQKPSVQCYPGVCPQITERHLRPSPECPVPVIVNPDDPIMCPYVVCNYSEETGKDLEHVSMVAMNSSTVRIRFTLPSLLVGLIGHAELHYTRDPSVSRGQWHIQKFARPKRLFDTPNIEYHLGNLKPGSTYYFQVKIVIEALQSGPESEIYKLNLPAAPTMPTTTTTTTTTTLPPIIMIDGHLNAIPKDFNTIKVSWRPFEAQEKRYIDGLQLKYKSVQESDIDWSFTPMIHRDLTNYILRDLHPGVSYVIDLVFKTPDSVTSTKIVSSKPVVIDLPTKPKDEYDFHISVDPANDIYVDSSKSVIHLNGVPHPTSKYIRVVKISYKNMDTTSDELNNEDNGMVHTFMVPSDDGTIVLEGLQPLKRYKAWFDLYLANGKTVSANAVDFMTKEGSLSSIDDRADDSSVNEAEALRKNHGDNSEIIRPYYIALTVVTLFAIIAGVGFVTLLCVVLRNKTSAKAPITRAPSESAYDNPTYKTYDGEKPGDETIKNGSIQA